MVRRFGGGEVHALHGGGTGSMPLVSLWSTTDLEE